MANIDFMGKEIPTAKIDTSDFAPKPTKAPTWGNEWKYDRKNNSWFQVEAKINTYNVYREPNRDDIKSGIEGRLKAHLNTNDEPETLSMILASSKQFLSESKARPIRFNFDKIRESKIAYYTMEIEVIEEMLGVGGFDMKILLIPAAIIGGLILLG